VIGNSTDDIGGGIFFGSGITNCIVYFNTAPDQPNFSTNSVLAYTCTYPMPTNGVGNITNAPLFVDTNNWADLRLQPNSPCIDAGNNDFVTTLTDLDGNPRIINGIVDMGAYEFVPLSPAEMVEHLIEQVNQSDLQHKQPLLATLEAALASIQRGNCHSAVGQLHAFQNKVAALVGADGSGNTGNSFTEEPSNPPPDSTEEVATLVVGGTSNPWLAGMPDGTTADAGDLAPTRSPVLVSAARVVPGARLGFTVTGRVSYGPGFPFAPPDGAAACGRHRAGSEHGMSDIQAPWNCLVGVFLDDTQPDLSHAPARLDFSTAVSRDYSTLSPALKQVFFIGDGHDSGGRRQEVRVPLEGTRLFLGTMDGFGWYNNLGSFTVTVITSADLLDTRSDPTFAVGLISAADDIITALDCDGAAHVAAKIHSIKHHPNGKVQMKIKGEAGKTYILEASTNLVNWEAICVVRPDADGNCGYEDAMAGKHQCRFYRLVGVGEGRF